MFLRDELFKLVLNKTFRRKPFTASKRGKEGFEKSFTEKRGKIELLSFSDIKYCPVMNGTLRWVQGGSKQADEDIPVYIPWTAYSR